MYTTAIVSILLLLSSSALASPQGRSAKKPCSPAVVALAAGIHLNIQGQYAEYNGTVAVEQIETTGIQGTDDTTIAFLLAKGRLEGTIQAGQNIRLTNQQIAPPGNPAVPGLAKYAAAQETEKALAAGLTGEYEVDQAALESLKSDIKQGIQLNENNLKNVSALACQNIFRGREIADHRFDLGHVGM